MNGRTDDGGGGEYGPSAGRRLHSRGGGGSDKKKKSMRSSPSAHHGGSDGGGGRSPRLTALDFELRPVRTLDIGHGGTSLVATTSTEQQQPPAEISDGEEDSACGSDAPDDDDGDGDDYYRYEDEFKDDAGDEGGDVLIGTNVDLVGAARDGDDTSPSKPPSDRSDGSPLQLPSSASRQLVVVPQDSSKDDDDAFLALQNKRYESMQQLGEMAVPGSSKPPPPPSSSPPPIQSITISSSSSPAVPRPTSGKGYFSFILSAANASNEASAAANGGFGDGDGGVGGNVDGDGDGNRGKGSVTPLTAPLSPASPDELMDVDDDDSDDGFSDLDDTRSSGGSSHRDHHHRAAGAAAAAAAAAVVSPAAASNDELIDVDDGSDSDESDFSDLDDSNDSVDDNDNDNDASTKPPAQAAKRPSSVSWHDESKAHQVKPHQYHRTGGNITFRTPKFFRDRMAPSPQTSRPAATAGDADTVGGSATQISAVKSPLSEGSSASPLTSASSNPERTPRDDPYPTKYTFAHLSTLDAAGGAIVASDIANEGAEKAGGLSKSSSASTFYDDDFATSLSSPNNANDAAGTSSSKSKAVGGKGKKKGLKNRFSKLRMSRRKQPSPTAKAEDTTVQREESSHVDLPIQQLQHQDTNDASYDESYSDVDDDDLACPPDLVMPGIGIASNSSPVSPSKSTALVVSMSQTANYKSHETRPDLDKFRDPETTKKKITPFSMWYDDEDDLVGRDDKEQPNGSSNGNNPLALVPSSPTTNNKPQSVAKMLSAFLSRGSKHASAAAVVYDTDSDAGDSSDEGDGEDDDESGCSRVGISRPTGCQYDNEEDAYGGGGTGGVVEYGTDEVMAHLITGPLQGYMTGLNPEALKNRDVKAIERTVHKHTAQGVESPARGMSRSKYTASGVHTTTYSTASLIEKGVDMVGAGGTSMKVYRLEGTGSGPTGTSEGRDGPSSTTHMPSPPESHPPTCEERAKSMAGTGASSLQQAVSGGRPSVTKPGRERNKTPNSILMSSLAYSALLNEDTIYDDEADDSDGEAASRSDALVEYKGALRAPSSALANHLGRSSCRSLAVRGMSSATSRGPAAPSTRAVTVSSDTALTVVSEGLVSTAPTIKIFVLLLQPRMRLFELVQLIYYPSVATIGDLVDLIPSNTTEAILGNQAYVGLCRPKDEGQMSIMTDLDMMASGTVEGGSANIYRGEILCAIPDGYSGEQCAKMARPILENQEFSKLMARSDPLAPNTEPRPRMHPRS